MRRAEQEARMVYGIELHNVVEFRPSFMAGMAPERKLLAAHRADETIIRASILP